ncbi:hypothetical protein B0H19DRAFT_1085572 [Mycena capillaripes]|nr:hypothetical protein B0H19DRAFT_1085572 [Mycena capillaripes]
MSRSTREIKFVPNWIVGFECGGALDRVNYFRKNILKPTAWIAALSESDHKIGLDLAYSGSLEQIYGRDHSELWIDRRYPWINIEGHLRLFKGVKFHERGLECKGSRRLSAPEPDLAQRVAALRRGCTVVAAAAQRCRRYSVVIAVIGILVNDGALPTQVFSQSKTPTDLDHRVLRLLIQELRRLTGLENSGNLRDPITNAVLTPPNFEGGIYLTIPDVVISGHTHPAESPGVIATLFRSGTEPVIFVGLGDMRVSHPHQLPPMRWLRHPIQSEPCWVIFGLVVSTPPLFVYVIIAIIDLCRIIRRLYCRLFGSPWDQTAHIAADFGTAMGIEMRIQTVSGPGGVQLTVVTFTSPVVIVLDIHRLPGVSPAQLNALLATLYKKYLFSLTVRADCALSLPGLMSFILRHHSLYRLTLHPGAIDTRSLTQESAVHARSSHIAFLDSPAIYIPHILHIERCVETLVITSATIPHALPRALAAVAVLPYDNACLRELTLDMSTTASRPTTPKWIPWRTDPEFEAGSTRILLHDLSFDDAYVIAVDSSIKTLLSKSYTVGNHSYLADFDDQDLIRYVGSNYEIITRMLVLRIGPEDFAFIGSDVNFT